MVSLFLNNSLPDSVYDPNDWRSSFSRRKILLTLSDSLKSLTPLIHSGKVNELNEELDIVSRLCDSLEMCFFHGLRTSEFNSNVPFWSLLERISFFNINKEFNNYLYNFKYKDKNENKYINNDTEYTTSDSEDVNNNNNNNNNSENSIQTNDFCIDSLHSSLARARGWIRMALNASKLEEFISILISNPAVLRSYYYGEAILCVSEEANMLLAILRNLKPMKFNINEYNTKLNFVSSVSLDIYSSYTNGSYLSLNNNSSILNNFNTGGFFNSIMKNIETRFDKIINSMDSIISDNEINEENNDDDPLSSMSLYSNTTNNISKNFYFNNLSSNSISNEIELELLILDDTRCFYSNLQPDLGIPNQIVKIFKLLWKNLKSNLIFAKPLSNHNLNELKTLINNERINFNIPICSDISTVSTILAIILYQLSDKFIPQDLIELFLNCDNIANKESKIKSLQSIFMNIKWFNKPLFIQIISYFSALCKVENSKYNNINLQIASIFLSPLFFDFSYNNNLNLTLDYRSYSNLPTSTSLLKNNIIMDLLNSTSSILVSSLCSSLVEFILYNSDEILKPLLEEINTKKNKLNIKCYVIRKLQETLILNKLKLNNEFNLNSSFSSIDLDDSSVDYSFDYIKKLYKFLSEVDKEITFSPKNKLSNGKDNKSKFSYDLTKEENNTIDIKEILSDQIWSRCGLIDKSPNTYNFYDEVVKRTGGILSIYLLTNFFYAYKDRSIKLCVDFINTRIEYCSIVDVAIYISRLCCELLCLIPSPNIVLTSNLSAFDYDAAIINLLSSKDINIATPFNTLARTNQWNLFNDINALQSLFDIGFLSFDEFWNNITTKVSEEPTDETFKIVCNSIRLILLEIIDKKPKNITELWSYYAEIKLNNEENEFKLNNSSSKIQSFITTIPPDQITNEKSEKGEEFSIIKEDIHINTDSNSNGTRTKSKDSHDTISEELNSNGIYNTVGIRPSSNLSYINSSAEFNEYENKKQAQNFFQQEISHVSYKNHMGITTKIIGKSEILTEKHIKQIENSLSKKNQNYDWKLLYRLSLHGASLSTMITKAKSYSPLLLIIQDSNNTIFGAFINDYLKLTEKEKYYGTNGSTTVFTFNDGTLRTFKWSYMNDYFITSSRENGIGIGGGGNYAIYLDNDLYNGTSGPCQTFNSPCLASSQDFNCIACELFALIPPTK